MLVSGSDARCRWCPGPCDLQPRLIHICEGSRLNGGGHNRLAVKYRTITRTNGPLRLTEIRQIMSPADIYTGHSNLELRQLKHSARFQINQADGRQGRVELWEKLVQLLQIQ